jgi:hypothetical protein
VQPVAAIDEHELEITGPRTRDAAGAFQRSVREAIDKA